MLYFFIEPFQAKDIQVFRLPSVHSAEFPAIIPRRRDIPVVSSSKLYFCEFTFGGCGRLGAVLDVFPFATHFMFPRRVTNEKSETANMHSPNLSRELIEYRDK